MQHSDALAEVLDQDGRYTIEAYGFALAALEYTMKKIGKRRHVTGQELLDGIKELAKREYGSMSRFVFQEWGIDSCRDFGEIVFNMVRAGFMKKRPDDSIEDFESGYDFQEEFERNYDWMESLRSDMKSEG